MVFLIKRKIHTTNSLDILYLQGFRNEWCIYFILYFFKNFYFCFIKIYAIKRKEKKV